jgi:hypothetical protein
MFKNCGTCEHLSITGRKGMANAGCLKTEFVVPHNWDGDKNEFIFWRVPTSCPLDDTTAQKTKKPQPEKTWTTRSFDSFFKGARE